jgi:cell wall-associated NlpC family hydrolase
MFVAHARMLPRTRRRRTTAVLTALALTVTVLLVVPSTAASAAPSVGDIEKQITAADNQLEPIIEDYNRIHAELQTNQAKTAALEIKLAPLQLQAQVATARLGAIAGRVYKGGPPSTLAALLNTSSTVQALDAMSTLDQIARQRLEQMKPLLDRRDAYAAAKKTLDQARAQLAAQDAALAAKKTTIQTQIAKLQKLRLTVYHTTGPIGTLRPVACPVDYTPGPGGIAARKACTAIGKPYVWAAAGPNSFDCSGLTLWAWAAAGVQLRHYTKWQWSDNNPVSRANLRPGDLVFYYPPSLHHMGIYVGGGWIVHAPHTGDYVRMAKLDSAPLAGFRRP